MTHCRLDILPRGSLGQTYVRVMKGACLEGHVTRVVQTSNYRSSGSGVGGRLYLLTMASNPPNSRKGTPLKRFKKSIADRFNTILSISRSVSSESPQPPALLVPNTNRANPLLEPLGGAGNQSYDAILPNSGTLSMNASAHARINPANAGSGTVTVVETSQRSISDRLSQDSSSTNPGDNYSDRLVKAGSVAWKALETALRLLESSTEGCPPLKSAVGDLVACLDLTHVSDCVRFHIHYHL